MKYIVVLCDGMSDYPIEALKNKTPMSVAKKPNMNMLAKKGTVGLCKTVADNLKPASDIANLSVMGYNAAECYTGRSPLEAVSIGIDLGDTDVTYRANLVTLNGDSFDNSVMEDYSAGEITTEEAAELIKTLKTAFDNEKTTLYTGISYRHCLVVKDGITGSMLTPPHDISGRPIKEYLPSGAYGEKLLSIMKRSYEILINHSVNLARIKSGKKPASSLWFWGEGTKPSLENYYEKFGKKGAVISAVDLIKGIGILAGMKSIDVEGATGNYDTNFLGKAEAAIDALNNGYDFAYIHLEAPDECGHHGDTEKKIFSIEKIDKDVIGTILKKMTVDYSILICPDHPTPICKMTHMRDPVPFLIYRTTEKKDSGVEIFDEASAKNSGLFIDKGYELIKKLFEV